MRDLLSDAQRAHLLWTLYDALLKHLVDVLSGDGPVKASMLDVARAFLTSQGITAATRPGMSRGLVTLQQQMDGLPFDSDGKPKE